MATVAEKKAAIGYRDCPTCDNCEHEVANAGVIRRFCTLHGWAVKARKWCRDHSFVTEEGNNADV